jgi:hypothetical protein
VTVFIEAISAPLKGRVLPTAVFDRFGIPNVRVVPDEGTEVGIYFVVQRQAYMNYIGSTSIQMI